LFHLSLSKVKNLGGKKKKGMIRQWLRIGEKYLKMWKRTEKSLRKGKRRNGARWEPAISRGSNQKKKAVPKGKGREPCAE